MIDPNTPLERLNAIREGTLIGNLGIEVTALGEDSVTATMPVDERTIQPMGLLHGGATAALIESLGSVGSTLMVDLETQAIVGVEINVNHLRAVRGGVVTGTARVVRAGRRVHVWQADVFDDEGRQTATGRLTIMVLEQGA